VRPAASAPDGVLLAALGDDTTLGEELVGADVGVGESIGEADAVSVVAASLEGATAGCDDAAGTTSDGNAVLVA
jgi:hypothetical protein